MLSVKLLTEFCVIVNRGPYKATVLDCSQPDLIYECGEFPDRKNIVCDIRYLFLLLQSSMIRWPNFPKNVLKIVAKLTESEERTSSWMFGDDW